MNSTSAFSVLELQGKCLIPAVTVGLWFVWRLPYLPKAIQ